jgi:hypothetical protein
MKCWNLYDKNPEMILKKNMYLAVFVFIVFSLSMAADKSADCVLIIASKGQVKISGAGYETGKDASLALLAGQTRIDLLPLSKISAIQCSPAISLKIIKGTAWVRCGNAKAGISSGIVTIEASGAVFSASSARVNVYSGFVTVKNGKKTTRVGRSMGYDIETGKAANMADAGAGDAARQTGMDKLDVLCTVDLESKNYVNARNAFAGAFTAFYHAGRAYFSFDNPKEDYDLNLDLRIEKKNARYLFNGTIKNPLTNETVAIINNDEPADEGGMLSGLSKSGIDAGKALQYYGSKVLAEGTKVFVEAEGGNTENANEIRQLLEKTPGVSLVKHTDFNGKKAVFEMQFTGNGYDLAEILNNIKVQNKSINIWKYSKFVVKLTII